jgi:hypothetical protein
VYEHGRGGRVGPLEEVVEVETPARLDDRSAGGGEGRVIVVVPGATRATWLVCARAEERERVEGNVSRPS